MKFTFLQFILHLIGLFFKTVPVKKNNLLTKFKEWGPIYEIRFDITVTNFFFGWTNVFRFVKEGTGFIRLRISHLKQEIVFDDNMVGNFPTKYHEIPIKKNKKYQIEIRTTKDPDPGATANQYTLEIFVDNKVDKHKKIEKSPAPLSDVLLYASDDEDSSLDWSHGLLESFSVSTTKNM